MRIPAPQWCLSLAHSKYLELKVSTHCAYQHYASVIPITCYSTHSLNLCAYQHLSDTHHLPLQSIVNLMVMANNHYLSLIVNTSTVAHNEHYQFNLCDTLCDIHREHYQPDCFIIISMLSQNLITSRKALWFGHSKHRQFSSVREF